MGVEILAMCENKGYMITLYELDKDRKRHYAVYVIKEGKNVFEGFYPSKNSALTDYHNMQEVYFGNIRDKAKI